MTAALQDRPVGLVPPHPKRRRHFCNDMTAEVHVGDAAFVTIVNPTHDSGLGWQLRYGDAETVRFAAASVVSSYDYLLSDGCSSKEAIRRLRILRTARRALISQHTEKTDG